MRALSQNDLKRRLAFSTVSQVSYILLGVAMANPWRPSADWCTWSIRG
jgi:multicomponent Na+:H+ antiporter subunit D